MQVIHCVESRWSRSPAIEQALQHASDKPDICSVFYSTERIYICATEYIREQRHLLAFGIRVFAETIFCGVACTSLELFDDHFPLAGPWQNAYSRAATLSLLFPKCPETTLLLLFPVPFGNNAQVLLWCLNSAYTPR